MGAIEELCLDIFPQYANVWAEQTPIHVPLGCHQVVLHSPEPHRNRYCYRLAASLVVPPHAKFVIKQASGDDADLVVDHFAGALHPPLALSLRTGLDDNETTIGEVIIPFNPDPWLDSPADLLTATPAGHISIQFSFFAVADELEGDDEVQNYDALYAALAHIDFGELRVLRIEGLKDEEDVQRLLFGDETDAEFGLGNMLSGATNLEVLVASLTYPREALLDAMVPGQPPFPELQTIHQQ